MWSTLKEIGKYRWENINYLWVRTDVNKTKNVSLKYSIPTKLTLPIKLKLFNRLLNNIITETSFLPITFPSGNGGWKNIAIPVTNSKP